MCEERGGKISQATPKNSIHAWYMKHAFQDFRGGWRSIARRKTKKKSAIVSRAEMAKTINLQRASAQAAASRSNIHLPSLGCTETSQWMCRAFNSLYTKRKSRSKENRLSTRLKSLIRSPSFDRIEDPVDSSSSLTELIPPCTVDFDVTNIAISSDSDFQTTGQPPSRRSPETFLSQKTCDSSAVPPGSACPRSPLRPGRHHRRKRSIFRAAKVALTGGRGNTAGVRHQVLPPMSSGIGIGRSRYSLSAVGMRTPTRSKRMIEKQHPTSPAPAALEKNPSRGTTMTMDTTSSTGKSSNASWPENYDMLTETFSTSSWSLGTDLDSPPKAANLHSPRERNLDSPRSMKLITQEWSSALHESDDNQDYNYDSKKLPSSPVTHPVSRKDIQKRQASAIRGVRSTGKDFQEAIVDIILDNDVNDLADLEEFLQGYFRVNTLYQDIIEQFFNDLSDDLVNLELSRAPAVFARLAATEQ